MPKIIENLREQLLTEARQQIEERGYSETTVRSVAKACGIGVGTVYNYFPSKEMLVGAVVYEDWKEHLKDMQTLPTDDSRVLLGGIYESLMSFAAKNEKLFSDSDAAKIAAIGSSRRHKMLRDQIAAFITPLCGEKNVPNASFAAEFISEALIGWAMEKCPFETVYPLFEKIIK